MFIRVPMVSEAAVGGHERTAPGGNVICALVFFVIAKAMRMNTVGINASIQEVHDNFVANLGADNRAEDSQPFRLRRTYCEGCVRVADVAGLGPFRMSTPGTRQWTTFNQVPAAGREVPGNVFGGDVVVADFRERRLQHDEQQTE